MFSDAIIRIQKLSRKFREYLANFLDFVALLSFRGGKAPDDQDIITLTMQSVCKRLVVNRLYRGMTILFSTGLMLLLLGTMLTRILLEFSFGLFVYYLVSLAVLFFVFLRLVLFPLCSLSSREKIALFIEQQYPSLNNSLISSIQLTRHTLRGKAAKYSGQMISKLIHNTASQLKILDMDRIVGKGFPVPSGIILIVSLVVFIAIYAFNHSYFHRNIPLLFSYFGAAGGITEKDFAIYSGPVLGDITLMYQYPLYTGLQKRVVYNTSGDIRAIKGSEVQISALSDRSLLSAEIIINNSVRVPLIVENSKTIKGTLSLFESGSFVFETTDLSGKVFRDPALHTIQVDQDQFPSVSINSPAKDLTVTEKDTIELQYNAKDDFGISETTLVFERENERNARKIASFGKRQTEYVGAYRWSLSELDLRSEEKIAYYIEVKDNDTISGPKTGSSKIYYLEVYGFRKKHQELIHLQEMLMREMLHLLADELTRRMDDERCTSKDYLALSQEDIQVRIERINNLFTDILAGMQEDTMANFSVYYSLENMRNKFLRITDRKQRAVMRSIWDAYESDIPVSVLNELQKIQDEEIAGVEDIILLLNEIIEKQKVEDILDTGKNLIQSQNTIEKLLDKLREGGDEKLNEKVLSEIRRIEETIQQMMEKLMKMAQGEHMDEFLNADALKKIEQNDIMEELNAMKDAFNKGDIDATLQAAQRLLSALQDMMNQMKSSSQNFADASFGDMLRDMDRLSEKISGLENKEREIAENTDKMKREMQERTSETMENTLKSFFEKQEKRVEMIKKDLAGSKEILAENTLLQEYLRVNRDLKRITEEREAMASRLSEFFGSEEDIGQFQRDSERLSELFRENAVLNREINKDPMQRDFLSLYRDLPQTEEKISHLEEMIRGWEAKEALDLAKEMLQNLGQLQNRMQNVLERKDDAEKRVMPKRDLEVAEKVIDAANQNQQIVQDLESVMQSLEEQLLSSLTEEDRSTLESYADEQQKLQEEAEELVDMADTLSRQNPFMDENADKQLDMAARSMGKAKGKLEKHDAQGAAIDERDSLYHLAQARKNMEVSKDRIEKGMMGGGIPMPGYVRGKREEGLYGFSPEKVEIPSEEAYKVPKEFRQDILDALKEGLPEKYKELNKDYYQRLVD
ncbi:MAG: DUF4175 family protein [Candidatus Loosdrechtia sp.]|uniref:DUF4175 family protein n=1 Tax=Candidatus Loosdrechtia sp. TaxID=3101272 RepID=UPI003A7223FE|nr:MAG: hypothetical protein QY305_01780 [Candidatus Jettenia sp. AMX2]